RALLRAVLQKTSPQPRRPPPTRLQRPMQPHRKRRHPQPFPKDRRRMQLRSQTPLQKTPPQRPRRPSLQRKRRRPFRRQRAVRRKTETQTKERRLRITATPARPPPSPRSYLDPRMTPETRPFGRARRISTDEACTKTVTRP